MPDPPYFRYRDYYLNGDEPSFEKEGRYEKIIIRFLADPVLVSELPVIYQPNDKMYNKLYKSDLYDTISLKIAEIPLIDTSEAEWEKIIEIRKDTNSINKLRRFKTFFHQNYSGKEKNFIQDDLLNRIEEYNNAVKDWGFETVISSLTLINTSVTSVGSSLVMALTGKPLEVAAATGVCVGIGNIALRLAKEKRKLMKLGRDHPLAYIIDAKKKLEKE